MTGLAKFSSIVSLVASLVFSFSVAQAETMSAKSLADSRIVEAGKASYAYKVEGVTCSGCEKMIGAKIEAINGVKGVQFYDKKDLVTKKTAHFLKVSFTPNSVTNDAILKAISSAGDHYKAVPVTN